jgi:hypothetical protein
MNGCSLTLIVAIITSGILICAIYCQCPNRRIKSSAGYGNAAPSKGDTHVKSEREPLRLSRSSHGKGVDKLDFTSLPGWPINPVKVNTFTSQAPGSKLSELGAKLINASEKSTEALPPKFQPLPELGPQRMWQPTWSGVEPTFVDKACEFFYPNPRLWARDLNELQFRRGLSMGQENLVEPVRARQSHIQLLAAEARSKKDPILERLLQTICLIQLVRSLQHKHQSM